MNKIIRQFLLIAISIFTALTLSAQCEPDTANCKDIGDPGQICPTNLPDAMLNAWSAMATIADKRVSRE